MSLQRRTFLQQTGWALAALGLQELGAATLSQQYAQVLAQSNPRKLALLVGINQYPGEVYDRTNPGYAALHGCVTDVELQRELLIHRFGFSDRAILTLTDQQATRKNIETAFQDHLIRQAQPGDVVVFHFSGYGTQLDVRSPTDPSQSFFQSGLVPVDGWLPSDRAILNDIPEETLWLLLKSLKTDQVTTILDLSHVPTPPLRGNLRVRARATTPSGILHESEQNFQAQLWQEVGFLPGDENFRQIPGVVLAAAGPTQLTTSVPRATIGDKAFEGQWQGFSAGLFTSALTQILWWATPATSISISFSRAVATVEQMVGQEQRPQILDIKATAQPGASPLPHLRLQGYDSRQLALSLYALTPSLAQGTDGVVIAVDEDGSTCKVWLAGLPAEVLEYYGTNSLLRVLGTDGLSRQLQVQSRDGLQARAKLCCASIADGSRIQVGSLVQEAVRVLPRQVKLLVSFDPSLDRVERIDATSAFSSFPWATVGTAIDQPTDYLFGRVQGEPGGYPQNSYGLFSRCRTVIPTTLGSGGEAIKTAVKRLLPQMQALLAAKLLQLTLNEGTSRLPIKARIDLTTPQNQVLMRRETSRAFQAPAIALAPEVERNTEVLTLPVGSRIRYEIENNGDRPLHAILLGLDSSGNLIALYTKGGETGALVDEVIEPSQHITIPRATASFEWEISGPPGPTQTYLILSHAPFTQTLNALTESVRPIGDAQRINSPTNPLTVAQAVLQDLANASAPAIQTAGISIEDFALDVNAWATLNFVYQVV